MNIALVAVVLFLFVVVVAQQSNGVARLAPMSAQLTPGCCSTQAMASVTGGMPAWPASPTICAAASNSRSCQYLSLYIAAAPPMA